MKKKSVIAFGLITDFGVLRFAYAAIINPLSPQQRIIPATRMIIRLMRLKMGRAIIIESSRW